MKPSVRPKGGDVIARGEKETAARHVLRAIILHMVVRCGYDASLFRWFSLKMSGRKKMCR